MIKNFFTIAWRNLLRNKGFSFINISGLAIGMASAILILLWIQNELSMDRFHAKEDRLYIAANRDHFNGELWAWTTTPKILGPTLKLEYANDVEDVARVNENNFLFTVGDKHLNAQGYFTDPAFLTMFSFPLLKVNAGKALNSVYNIVVLKNLQRNYGELMMPWVKWCASIALITLPLLLYSKICPIILLPASNICCLGNT